MSQVEGGVGSKPTRGSLEMEKRSLLFASSALLFRMGLALQTFEVVRPFGILVADYLFFSSLLLLLLCTHRRRLLESKGSGVLIATALVVCGGFLSSVSASGVGAAAGPLMKLFTVFGLFAPLALVHSKNSRENLYFLIGGILANCGVTLLQASIFPRIVDLLSVNNVTVDTSDIGRFSGLAGHSNFLGLSAALAVLIGAALWASEKNQYVRWGLSFQVFACTGAALLSGSRTFLVALIPSLIVLMLTQTLYRRVVLRTVVGIVVLWAGINYVVPELLSEYTSRFSATNADDSENYSRLLTAGVAVAEISQKPILGWGADRFGEAGMMFIPEAGDFIGAHVTFLQYWYATGLLGAIGFLALFAIPVRRMIRALKSNSSVDLGNALRLGLSAYALLFISSNLHPILFNRFLYVPLFMFAGLTAQAADPIKVRQFAGRAVAHLPARNIQATS